MKSNIQINQFMDMLIGLPDDTQDSLNIETKHYDDAADMPDNPLPDPPDGEPTPVPPITVVSFKSKLARIDFWFDQEGDLVSVDLRAWDGVEASEMDGNQ